MNVNIEIDNKYTWSFSKYGLLVSYEKGVKTGDVRYLRDNMIYATDVKKEKGFMSKVLYLLLTGERYVPRVYWDLVDNSPKNCLKFKQTLTESNTVVGK